MELVPKKIKILLAFLAIVAGFLVTRMGFVFYHKLRPTNISDSTLNTPGVLGSQTTSERVLIADSDKDGLPDREEIIYGTNPLQPDTDSDGFLDGEEIASGHDPLDKQDSGKNGPGKNGASVTANFTNRLADLAVATMIDDTGKIDPKLTDGGQLADAVLSAQQEMAAYFYVPTLHDSDIKVSSDNSKEAIIKYVDMMGPIIEEEALGANRAIINALRSPGYITSQDDGGYRKAYSELRLIEAPSSWKEIHKQTLTILLSFSRAFEALEGDITETDPLKAVAALNQIQGLSIEVPTLLTKAANLAKSQNVVVNDSIIRALGGAN